MLERRVARSAAAQRKGAEGAAEGLLFAATLLDGIALVRALPAAVRAAPKLLRTGADGVRAVVKGVVTRAGARGPGAAGRTASGFAGLNRAGEFGIQPYNQLTKALKGTGLQAHHLLEQRFAGVLGQDAGQMASVAVTKAEHQVFTNAWRAAIPYGQGTANATRQQVLDAARQIYSGHPEIVRTLGL